jgi:hypothetical protein
MEEIENTSIQTTGDRQDLDPGIAVKLEYYVEHYMAFLGPFVSSVFFALILSPEMNSRRQGTYARSVDISLAKIARGAGICRRKSINALKVLKDHGIIIQRSGRGRGRLNRYYFLPCETWLCPGEARGR